MDAVARAAESLGKLGATGGAAGAVADLRGWLFDPDGEMRASAAQALGALGPVAADVVPDLIRALADPAWGDVREETRRRFIFGGLMLVPMEQIDRFGSRDQRMHAATALGKIGPPTVVIPPLVAAVSDPNDLVRTSAFVALRELRPASDAALAELRQTHPDETVREWAAGVLNPKAGEG